MANREDEWVAKKVVKMDWVTKSQLDECLQNFDGSIPLIDELVDTGYVSKSQKEILMEELPKDKKSKAASKSPSMANCQSCGAEFNPKLLEGGRKLKCGKCGEPLSLEVVPQTIARKEPPSLTPKVQVPDYKIMDFLGQDVTGMTYIARPRKGKKETVILKVFDKKTIKDKQFVKQLTTGVNKSLALENSAIRTNREIEFEKDCAYVVSEYIEGDSLYGLFQKGTTFSAEKAIKIITKVVKALKYAYENGLTHGNICPSNILISKSGKVVVANFGVPTKVVDNALYLVDTFSQVPFYLAPEYLTKGQKVDHRSDVFSLGTIFYELLTKKPAFEGSSPFEIINLLSEDKVPSIKICNPAISIEISTIVERMMDPEPEERYDNYSELLKHLKKPSLVHKSVDDDDDDDEDEDEEEETTSSKKSAGKASKAKDKKKDKDEDKESKKGKKEEKGEKSSPQTGRRDREQPLAMKRKTEVPIGLIIVLCIMGLAGFSYYRSYKAEKRTEAAENVYLKIRGDYTKNRTNPAKWKKLDKQFSDYINDYKDQEKYIEYVNVLKKKLKSYKKKTLEGHVRFFTRQASKLSNKRKGNFVAALEKLKEIPKDLLQGEIKTEVEQLRQQILLSAETRFNNAYSNLTSLLKDYDKLFAGEKLNKNAFSKNRLNKTKKSLGYIINNYPATAKEKPEGKLADFIRKCQVGLVSLEKKEKDYVDFVKSEKQKVSEQIFQQFEGELQKAVSNYDYKRAISICRKLLGKNKRSLSQKTIDKVNNLIGEFSRLHQALFLMTRRFNNVKREKIKVGYEEADYTVTAVNISGVALKGASFVNWGQLPNSSISKLVALTAEDQKPANLIILSVLARKLKDNALAYNILQKAASEPAAQTLLKELEVVFSQQIKKELELAKSLRKNQYQQSLTKLIEIKNDYLVNDSLKEKYSDDLDKVYRFALLKKMRFSSKKQKNEFLRFKSTNEIRSWDSRARYALNNGLLVFSFGRATIKNKNVHGIAGLCRLKGSSDKLIVQFSDYILDISGRGSVLCTVNNKPKINNTKIPSNRWFLFEMYVSGNKVVWFVNFQKQFESRFIAKKTKNWQLQGSGSQGIDLDNLIVITRK